MVKPKVAIIAAMLVAAAAIWFFCFHKTDKDRVLERLRELTEYISKADGEKGTTLILKSQLIGTLFAEKFEVNVDFYSLSGTYSPEEIGANLVRSRQVLDAVQLTFHDTKVTFPQPEKAVVNTTGQIVGKAKNGDRIREIRELTFTLTNTDGKWRFASCKVREVLRK